MYWCIYQITNKINGNRYIGQHRYYNEDRPMERKGSKLYRGSGQLLWQAYKKYGFSNFTTEILYKRILNKSTANSMEIYAIAKYKPEYNISKGGTGGASCKHTEEFKQKLSQMMKGKPKSEAAKAKQSQTMKELYSAGLTKRWTSDARKKQSEALKGRKFSEETKRKMSESAKRRWGGIDQ